jgi:GxxExxY protein
MRSVLLEAELTHAILSGFYEVYGALGFGFLERIYQAALEVELRARGHRVDRQVPVTIEYKQVKLGTQRLDMIVDQRVVVEIKSSYELPATATRQLLNYLRATHLEVGLLLHFGPKPEFQRVVRSNVR